MRRPFIAGNWKMNTTREEAAALADAVVQSTRDAACDLAICVPFPHLQVVHDITLNTHVRTGSWWASCAAPRSAQGSRFSRLRHPGR